MYDEFAKCHRPGPALTLGDAGRTLTDPGAPATPPADEVKERFAHLLGRLDSLASVAERIEGKMLGSGGASGAEAAPKDGSDCLFAVLTRQGREAHEVVSRIERALSQVDASLGA